MQLERALLQGAQDLERLSQELKHRRERLLQAAAPVAAGYSQANADWRVLEP
jgi:hypothetical protein